MILSRILQQVALYAFFLYLVIAYANPSQAYEGESCCDKEACKNGKIVSACEAADFGPDCYKKLQKSLSNLCRKKRSSLAIVKDWGDIYRNSQKRASKVSSTIELKEFASPPEDISFSDFLEANSKGLRNNLKSLRNEQPESY